jgi:hypothetical protein
MGQLNEIPNVSLVGPLKDYRCSFFREVLLEIIVSHTHALNMGLVLELSVLKLSLLTQV